MMGSGKSSIAPLLSSKINIPYVDTDTDLVEIMDAEIKEIFTSLTKEKFAVQARQKNLNNLFGKTAIERLVSLSSGGDKDEALAEYKDSGCWWIEDKPANADLGLGLGLKSILVNHGHNKDYDGEAVVVKKWKEIYKLITTADDT